MSDNVFLNENVLVTGASGLIGKAISYKFLEKGYQVIGTYNQGTERINQFKEEISNCSYADKFKSYQCQLLDENSIKNTAHKILNDFEKVNVLILNAGLKFRSGFMFTSNTDINDILNINLRAVMQITKFFLKNMIKHKKGRIVVIGSRAGGSGMPNQSVYSATKSALTGWIKSIAFELGSYGITANVVSPGALQENTDIYSEEEQQKVCDLIGLKRLGLPEEVAHLVLFLCSNEASYISGSEIVIDGAARF